ncbi:MAG TPA: hypothetical protein VF469_36905 [Kofleriaceae bacterium]
MPLLADLAQTLDDASKDAAAPEPEVAEPEVANPEVADPTSAEFSADGAVPEVADTGAIVPPGETASEQAFGDKPTAQSGDVGGGMFEPGEYQAACQAAGTPDKWDDRYVRGHTAASQWTQPYEGRYDMTFTLKPGSSASQAVKDFLTGPTIADYRVIGVAFEMDELRDDLGDQKFDQLFGSAVGSEDAQVASTQRLKITAGMYTIPFRAQMLQLAAEHDAVDTTEEPAAPEVAAQIEEKPIEAGVTAQPAPEMIADEMGVEREQELV